MAQRVITLLEDDIDGGEASETVTFALDGFTYELDVNDLNAKELRTALEPFIAHARRVGGRRVQGVRASGRTQGYDPKAVRRWAEANNIRTGDRGRIPQSVVEQFKAAGN
jgi:hypothetical protein